MTDVDTFSDEKTVRSFGNINKQIIIAVRYDGKRRKSKRNSFHCVDCSQGRRKQSDNLWENIKKRKSMTNNYL